MGVLNIKNRTIFCKDNLDILQGINSNCIDLIYLDPPFNKKKEFTAPMGSSAEGASFRDWFMEKDVKDEWIETIKEDYDGIYQFLTSVRNLSSFQSSPNKHYLYNYCYLCYMAIRLIEMHRILKDTGSIYLHCDPTMSHYLKILMDLIFGEKNFRNEILWKRTYDTGAFKKRKSSFASMHDIIFFYVKKNASFNIPIVDYPENYIKNFTLDDNNGKGKYYWADLAKPSENSINRLIKEGEVKSRKKGKWSYKRYYNRVKDGGIPIGNWWDNINRVSSNSLEKTGYPTQKPIALLERIIKASSNEGDVVLDPFCGCATTCIASEKLKRQWIGIDISIKAYDLVRERLKKEVANPENLFDYEKALNFSIKPPVRTDTNGGELPRKYVYLISNEIFPKGIYKVGIAKDIDSRLNSYQTSDPERNYKLEYKQQTQYFREIESFIIQTHRYKKEWVKGNLEDIINNIKNYKKK